MDIICKFNGETVTCSMEKGESLWDIIEDMVHLFWNLSPSERNWKRKAKSENFALFEGGGLLHDVFALKDDNITTVYVVTE